jgi:hypothetical protein
MPKRRKTGKVLEAIHAEIHIDLRESDKKRDQVIAFYLLVLVGLFNAWDRIEPIRGFVLGGIWIAGLLSFLVVMKFRWWHVHHGAAIVTLQRLLIDEEPVTLDRCEVVWKKVNDGEASVGHLMYPLGGVEAGTTLLFAFLTSLPAYLLLQRSGWAWFHITAWLAFSLDTAVYVLVLTSASAFFARKAYSFDPKIWVFRWLRNP